MQALMDRLYRTYLEPPTFQPARCWLVGAIATTTEQSFQLGTFSVAEDKELLRNGIVIEVGSEQLIVTAVDDPTLAQPTVTVERGAYGTTATAHTLPAEVKLSPLFTKQTAFESLRDNIVSIHPKLFTIDVVHLSSVAPHVYPCTDDLAISVISAWPFEGTYGTMDITAQVVDYHPRTGGRAFITAGWAGDLWIRYRKRMGVATDLTTTLASIGFEDVWSSVVMAGAAADLMAGRDLPESHVDYVSKLIESETVPVGTKQSLAVGLRRYSSFLLEQFASEMKAEYKPVAVRRSAFRKSGRI
jgi:hypothetical protein